jgi:polyisoprenoid-binding protein YceI
LIGDARGAAVVRVPQWQIVTISCRHYYVLFEIVQRNVSQLMAVLKRGRAFPTTDSLLEERPMRKTLAVIALALFLGTGNAAAQATYSIDTAHSNVGFKVRHLVARVTGSFNDFDGTITVDFENLDRSSVEFVIKSASVDTGDEKRDGHLRSADFFDVEQWPEITFKSNKITKKDKDTFVVAGTLTIRGTSNPVVLNVDYLGEIQAMGGTRAGFEVSTSIDRRDYGVSWNRLLDSGGLVLGDDVEVMINLEVVKQDEEAGS